jgi:D-lactate dehydrogenase (cytochrome)
MAACIAHSKLENLEALPTLFLEFHGTQAGVREQAESVQAIVTDMGGLGFAWAADQETRNKLWTARHNAYYAAIASRPNVRGVTTDVCVPISRLADAILGAKEDIAASGLSAPMVGHVGDGNFHTVILVDQDDPTALDRAWALDRKIVARGLALGGTCSGEHGVGMGKAEFLEQEHGMEALAVMCSIKNALDPKGILNPGKMFRN